MVNEKITTVIFIFIIILVHEVVTVMIKVEYLIISYARFYRPTNDGV